MAMMWDIENGYKDGQDHGMFASSKEPNVDWLNPHPFTTIITTTNALETLITKVNQQVN